MPFEPRFVVGIDLGTTNSVMAAVALDAGSEPRKISPIPIPQRVGGNRIAVLDLLPSFIGVFPDPLPGTGFPWVEKAEFSVGQASKDLAGLSPGRVVQSAKSWLSHNGVNREEAILPWGIESAGLRLSPVAASAEILRHLRETWDAQHTGAGEKLKDQDVIVTVPASFDEFARTLTLRAAREAGMAHVTLVEEPQAAFYWWIESHRDRWDAALPGGGIVLVCDVGGGTTDLSLIQISPRSEGPPAFERLAVGRHLLLGGDNVDQALAKMLEAKAGRKLDLKQWTQLVSHCRDAKERLLSGESVDAEMEILLPGSSSKLIGGATSVTLLRAELEDILLQGFVPMLSADASGTERTRAGLMQQGLPYESDPAITRHILSFLRSQASVAAEQTEHGMVRPDAILFNGGVTRSNLFCERVTETVAGWFGEKSLPLLRNDEPERAVSLGAATYGLSRRGEGLRIRGGSARAFFVQSADSGAGGVCVLPHGSEEGKVFRLELDGLRVRTNEAVQFSLFSSSTHTGAEVGERVQFNDELDALPPLVTVLEFGKSGEKRTLPVALEAELTALGTLSVSCVSTTSPHSWKLEFSLERSDATGPAILGRVLDVGRVQEAGECVRAVFSGDSSPEALMRSLEESLGLSRDEWTIDTLRALWPTVLAESESRGRSPSHEARWLNLAGHCLRPGRGVPGDPIRCKELWREVYGAGVIHKRSPEVWKEWWILWRRVAAGLKAGQQAEVLGSAQRFLGGKKLDVAKTGRGAPDKSEFQELWMMAASMERVESAVRIKLGRQALKYLKSDELQRFGYWAIGRLGARRLVHGEQNLVLSRQEIEAWARELNGRSWKHSRKTALDIAQLGRVTGDRSVDLSEDVRNALAEKMRENGAEEEETNTVTRFVPWSEEERNRVLADTMPSGLLWEET